MLRDRASMASAFDVPGSMYGKAAYGHRPGSIYQAEDSVIGNAESTSSTATASTSTTARNKSPSPSVPPPVVPTPSPLDDQASQVSVSAKKRSPMQWLQLSSHAVICVTVLGVVLGFLDGSLFSWHPILMTLGFVGFMGEGVVAAVAFRLHEGKDRVASIQKHAAWQISMLVSALAGFYAIYLNKVSYGKPHFVTLHARAGATTLVLALLVPLLGAVAFKSLGLLQSVPEQLRPRIKLAHRSAGSATFLLALATAFLGISTPSVAKGLLTAALKALVLALAGLVSYQLVKHPSAAARDHLDAASKLV